MDLSKKYKNKTNRELSVLSAEIKASVVEGLVETMLSLVTTSSDSSGTILLDGTKSGELPEHKVPLVSCTPGSFTGGGATILGKYVCQCHKFKISERIKFIAFVSEAIKQC